MFTEESPVAIPLPSDSEVQCEIAERYLGFRAAYVRYRNVRRDGFEMRTIDRALKGLLKTGRLHLEEERHVFAIAVATGIANLSLKGRDVRAPTSRERGSSESGRASGAEPAPDNDAKLAGIAVASEWLAQLTKKNAPYFFRKDAGTYRLSCATDAIAAMAERYADVIDPLLQRF